MSSFWDALSFLTILPKVSVKTSPGPAPSMAQALAWFPVVGIFIGLITAGIITLGLSVWPVQVASFLGVAALAILTGGLHLDGFSDTVDGLAAFKDPPGTLQVMRDSRIGALGATALILLLGLKWSLLQAIPVAELPRALSLACALSRFGMVVSAQRFPYVSGQTGLGRQVTDAKVPRQEGLALLVSAGLAVLCAGLLGGLLLLALTLAGIWGVNRIFLSRLGGITGDTLGAVNEIIEASVLLWMAAVFA